MLITDDKVLMTLMLMDVWIIHTSFAAAVIRYGGIDDTLGL